jgi:hypothetical protein
MRLDETLYYPTYKNIHSVVGFRLAKTLRDHPLPASVVMLVSWVIFNIDDAKAKLDEIGEAERNTLFAALGVGGVGLLFRQLT